MANLILDSDEELYIKRLRQRKFSESFHGAKAKLDKAQEAFRELSEAMDEMEDKFRKLNEVLEIKRDHLTVVHPRVPNLYNPNLNWLQKGLIALEENPGTGLSVTGIIDYIRKYHEPGLSDAARVGLSNALSGECDSEDPSVYREKQGGGNYLYYLKNRGEGRNKVG